MLSKEVSELRNRARRRGTPNNVEALLTKKEEYKTALIETSNTWIRNKLSNLNISDINIFWKRYRALFGDKQTNYIGNLMDENGKLCCTDAAKENVLFDTFFSGKHLSSNSFDPNYEKEVKEIYTQMKMTEFPPQSMQFEFRIFEERYSTKRSITW